MARQKTNSFASQYIDPALIVHFADKYSNDQELGEAIRRYVDKCYDKAKNDEPFASHAPLRSMGTCPSDIQNILKKIKDEQDQQFRHPL